MDFRTFVSQRERPAAAHQLAIADAVDVFLSDNEKKFLVLTVPPRHGASTVFSEWFPAWAAEQHPNKNGLLVSYADWTRPAWLSDTWMYRPVGGMTPGRAFDFIVLDSVIKNDEEAQSQRHRDRIWAAITHQWAVRRAPGGKLIIVGPRWHKDDHIGRMTDPQNPHYSEKIAQLTTALPLAASIEAPLWPEEFGAEYLTMQKSLDPAAYTALWQGQP